MAGRVVVVGAINVDFVVVAPRLPGPGETVAGADLQHFGGGKGANAAVAAARAGALVRLIGAVGADDTGRGALDELRAEGVDTTGVAVVGNVATGVALIVVDTAGENQIALGPGANGALTGSHVRRSLAAVLSDTDCVLVCTEIPDDAVVAAVQAATEANLRCILNPAPVSEGVVDAITCGPILTPNESELADLAQRLGLAGTGVGPGDELAAVSARSGSPALVTLGAAGIAVAYPDGRGEQIPARAAEARDTTGAGDTFNGVLAARLAYGDDLAAAARTAVVAASLSVTAVGARAGMPTGPAIDAASG